MEEATPPQSWGRSLVGHSREVRKAGWPRMGHGTGGDRTRSRESEMTDACLAVTLAIKRYNTILVTGLLNEQYKRQLLHKLGQFDWRFHLLITCLG